MVLQFKELGGDRGVWVWLLLLVSVVSENVLKLWARHWNTNAILLGEVLSSMLKRLAWQWVEFEFKIWTQTQAMSSGLGLELETCNLRVSLILANEFGSQTHTQLITQTQSQTLESNSKFPVKYSTIQTKYNVIQVRLGEYYIYILWSMHYWLCTFKVSV